MDDLTLGKKIRIQRLAKNMTQEGLAGDFITRNMLSQIENDCATPSMKTMAYLADKLEKPIGYFLDRGSSEASLSYLIARMIQQNESGDYEASVHILEEEIEENPAWADNKIIMDLYMNSHMYLADRYLKSEDFTSAKAVIMKVLKYEKQLLRMMDAYLYKVYDLLAEACSGLGEHAEAKGYYEKGRTLINRLVASREVQSMYIRMMEGEQLEPSSIEGVDTTGYDDYSLARFHMVAGTSMYRCGRCNEAVTYLEKALAYYSNLTNSTVTKMLYEQLSKCYSEMEDHDKAYEYLKKAHQSL